MRQKIELVLKYGIVGGVTAVLDWCLLFLFTDILKIYYLLSQLIALLLVTVVNFTGQKYWTFQNYNKKDLRRQFVTYGTVAVCNLFFNTFLLYVLVDIFAVWYLYAQVVSTFIIASFTFFMYKFFIFRSLPVLSDE